MAKSKIKLSPVQQDAFDWFLSSLDVGNIFHCWCSTGRGRSTVIKELHKVKGGALVTIQNFVQEAQTRHPLDLEDALYTAIYKALRKNDHVFVDDFHIAAATMNHCHFYPRSGYLDSPALALANYVIDSGKKLLLGADRSLPDPLNDRAYGYPIEKLTPADYEFLCTTFLGKTKHKIDFGKVHRFAPNLHAHQLKLACHWIRMTDKLIDADYFIDYLRSQQLASNVSLSEVANVELHELKGVDDVIRSLEANIIVPLENDELANELQVKPKRGVLLVGPPGTGKTTVGRALAHRLKGKFLLIDGTFISGTHDFYSMIHRIFETAKENAPSVIFIDDSDVIFESGQEHGLYRYLLTMLDGLESESAGRVCVMMTAMDVGNLPPALVRSGRIELWLEMKLPDASARLAILEQQLANAPKPLNEVDSKQVVAVTEGFTGADLKRTFEDGKALYAFDLVSKKEVKSITDYFIDAAENVQNTKECYAEAASRANAAHPARPAWFNPYSYDES